MAWSSLQAAASPDPLEAEVTRVVVPSQVTAGGVGAGVTDTPRDVTVWGPADRSFRRPARATPFAALRRRLIEVSGRGW